MSWAEVALWLVAKVAPSPEAIASVLAARMQSAVNKATMQKSEEVARWAQVASKALELATWGARCLGDGVVSDEERDEAASKLVPVVRAGMRCLEGK